MKTLLVDENNDLCLCSSNSISWVSGGEGIAQSCKQAMQSVLGEMPYAADRGIPIFDVAFVGTPDLAAFEAASRAILITVPDVVEVSKFSARVIGDELRYSAEIVYLKPSVTTVTKKETSVLMLDGSWSPH